MKKIKVSIIVPIYKTEKYLRKCVDSLINQTLKDIEIILINDGSPNDTDSIISEYKDKRLKYIKKENTGIGNTRNMGIDLSLGEYILFIDSDDYIDFTYAEKVYNKAKKDNCDLVISNFYKDYNGRLEKISYKIKDNTNVKNNPSIINNINYGPCNKLYKKSLIDNIRFLENRKYEDLSFVFEVLLSASNIGYVDEYLSYYVIHSNSETTTRDSRIKDILYISKLLIKLSNECDVPKKEMTDLLVMILADYTIQQRYIKDKRFRKEFIDEAFSILDSFNAEWKKCNYLKNFSKKERIIKTSKLLTIVYCNIYSALKR